MRLKKNQVLDVYNENLKKVQKVLRKKGTTTNLELEKFANERINNFLGVYSLDQIPELKNGDKIIFNLSNHNQKGTHWCCLYLKNGKKYIYDSFGRKVLGGNYKYTDKTPEQKIKEKNCGQRCLAWLLTLQELGLTNTLLI